MKPTSGNAAPDPAQQQPSHGLSAAGIWLFAWDRISDLTRSAVLFVIAAAAIGAAFLAINLHIANNGSHPWLLPADGFDEGIDLDSELPAIQIVIATVCILVLLRLRRTRADGQGGKEQ